MEKIFLPDNEGFLSSDYNTTINKIKNTYDDLFLLIRKVNKLIYNMYNDLDIKNNDIIAIFLLSSFSKIHKSFQSAAILYSYGLEDDVHILFRTMFENLFISTSIKKNKNNYEKLIKNQEIEDGQKTNDLIDLGLLKQTKIKINHRDKTNIWEFANEADLSNIFSAYTYLSSYVHLDLRNLEKSIDKNEDEISAICISPSVNNIGDVFTEMIGLLLTSIDTIKNYSTKNYDEQLKQIKEAHILLQKKYIEIIEEND